jgi:hypothetical protein
MITQLANGQTQFAFNGLAGRSYTIEASTNLVHWQPVETHVAGMGPVLFTNAARALPYRFFRLKSAP